MNRIKIILIIIFTLFIREAVAQISFNMCGIDTLTYVQGDLYDSGGQNGQYQINENCTLLIQPSCADSIILTFTQFTTESGFDFLLVYDGTTTAAPLLLLHSGNIIPQPVITISGSMLIVWSSDGTTNDSGFSAHWSTVNFSQLTPMICYPAGTMICCGIEITHFKINPVGNPNIGIDNYKSGGSYSDFSCTDSMTIYTGIPYTFSVTTGFTYPEAMRIWIDFDNNGILDSINEKIIEDDTLTFHVISPIIFNSSLIGAMNQRLRLRIISDYDGNPPFGPCTNPLFGTVEDYMVSFSNAVNIGNIYFPTENGIHVFPNPNTDFANIEIQSSENDADFDLKLMNMQGDVVLEKLFSGNSVKLNCFDLSAGIYSLLVSDKEGNRWKKKLVVIH